MDAQAMALPGGTSLVMLLVMFAVSGLIVGALARFALPGPDAMNIGRTMLYGIGGSLLGGLASQLLGVQNSIISLVAAVAGAAALIWFFTRRKPSR